MSSKSSYIELASFANFIEQHTEKLYIKPRFLRVLIESKKAPDVRRIALLGYQSLLPNNGFNQCIDVRSSPEFAGSTMHMIELRIRAKLILVLLYVIMSA